MKKAIVSLMFILMTSQALAGTIIIPDPKKIKSRTNAIIDVKTFKGGQFGFYFVELSKANHCKKLLKKQKGKFLRSKISHTPLRGQVKLDGSDYTFATGQFKGQKVFKVDSCKRSKNKLKLLKVSKK